MRCLMTNDKVYVQSKFDITVIRHYSYSTVQNRLTKQTYFMQMDREMLVLKAISL